MIDWDLLVVKEAELTARQLGLSDVTKLLCNHGHHFNVDPIELVKTGPDTRLDHTREDSCHYAILDLL